jgi:molybdopterin synthase catalytic subunit/molybdopterin converting factor small subunit
MMQIQVLLFGVLKDWFGASTSTAELPEGATVADLLERLSEGRPTPFLRSIAVSVNAEFSSRTQVLHTGDVVGLLPPVSGGSADAEQAVVTALTYSPIDAEELMAAAKRGEDGGAVVFDGIVRNNSHDRQTLYLDYEAYEEMAAKQMHELAQEACRKFGVRHVTLVHRLGRLQIGETSVLIIVASAHRAEAFEACRWLIDSLKKTVPIWKHETFVDGAVWAAGEPFPAELAVAPPEPSHDL